MNTMQENLSAQLEEVLKSAAEQVAENYNFNHHIDSAVENYDFDPHIKEAADSYDFDTYVESAIDSSLENISIDDKASKAIENVMDEYDFSSQISSYLQENPQVIEEEVDEAVKNYDFESKVKEEADEKIVNALNTLESLIEEKCLAIIESKIQSLVTRVIRKKSKDVLLSLLEKVAPYLED